jgi:hypothetical protein
MRPVRIISNPVATTVTGDNAETSAPSETKATTPPPEEEKNGEAEEEDGAGSDDDDLPFVVDITGDDGPDIGNSAATGSFAFTEVKQEEPESKDVWSLLNASERG